MKRGALPLNALRAFEATMRHGQMRLAADELGVTHGAVSRQVRLLEEILEVPLFEGPRNKLVPTQTALELEPALTEAFDGIEVAVTRAMQRESRFLDVSCTGTLAMRWLIPRLVDFQTAHPKIEVRLTGEYGPVVSPKLAASVDLDAPETLHTLPALHTKTRPAAWADWCREKDLVPPTGGRVFEHFYFLLEAATAGLGVAIAPEVLVRDDVAAGRLLAPFGFAPTGQAYVALRPRRPNRDAQLFIAWLEDAAMTPGPAS
ncbi:LysR substrate-binding domain-containing protein [Afifella marina]|uniref:Regulatory helix-turn-helix protein, lysR family n=1 Tax=Afifella marina DSM 2698 TaxID=1120955 RepID=A0A1G5MHI6_AFIMA|nr:LysR substrate-binding domain-containing protein [Afifella marina]MBK1625362.1 hypothetical protein [Afifella marina DSM 2698]MBK1629023.1 hypothetical protein [Afifella marina]MBK5916905.1 hypothetical protein [Afifella marina]RAI22796.1 hypothetical protein CH311_03845 [Afifella marina DSM 2698]SCZ24131.1 regulatory helix-turn-helix protein, lysR family [Afifella marina DSM 2698]